MVRGTGLRGDGYGGCARLGRRGVWVKRSPGSIVCGEACLRLHLSWAALLSNMVTWWRWSGVADDAGHDPLWEGTSCPCRVEVGVPLGRPHSLYLDGVIDLTRDGVCHAPCPDHIPMGD